MTLSETPPEWNSPYYPIRFVFDFYKQTFTGVTDTGGNATLTFPTNYPTKLTVGNSVYIEGGVYEGEHEILTVNSQSSIVIDTPYIGDTTDVCRNIVTPTFYLYKGYSLTEEFPTELPQTLVADLGKPPYNPDYQVSINVSGWLKRIFTITPPADGIDFNMFNKFRLWAVYDAADQYAISPLFIYPAKKVINSSITTDDLMAYYLNGLPLTSSYNPIVFDCDQTIITRLSDTFVINFMLEGVPGGGDFNNDFNDDFSG